MFKECLVYNASKYLFYEYYVTDIWHCTQQLEMEGLYVKGNSIHSKYLSVVFLPLIESCPKAFVQYWQVQNDRRFFHNGVQYVP